MSLARPQDAERWRRQFGARVRELRLARGVSQMDLAFEMGMDPTYLSDVERGKRNLGLANIHLIAQALRVPVRELFPERPPRVPRH